MRGNPDYDRGLAIEEMQSTFGWKILEQAITEEIENLTRQLVDITLQDDTVHHKRAIETAAKIRALQLVIYQTQAFILAKQELVGETS